MSTEENKTIARRYWDAWNTGNVAILHEIASADYIFHDGSGRVVRGTPGGSIPRFRTAFPDLHFVIEDVERCLRLHMGVARAPLCNLPLLYTP